MVFEKMIVVTLIGDLMTCTLCESVIYVGKETGRTPIARSPERPQTSPNRVADIFTKNGLFIKQNLF